MNSRVEWRAELIVVALTIAETAALWIVVSLVLSPPEGIVPPLAIFVLVCGAALTPRLLEALDIWNPAFEVLMTVAIAATTLFAVKVTAFPHLLWLAGEWLRQAVDALILREADARVSVWGMVVVSAYAWWRGRRRAEPSLDAAYTALRFGTPVVLAGVVAHSLAGVPVGDRALSAALIVFFAAALAAISVARIQAARAESRHGDSSVEPVSALTVMAPVLAVLAGAIIAAGIFTRSLLDTVIWALSPLLWGISLLLRALILIVAVVAFVIVWPILWLLSRLEVGGERTLSETEGFGEANGLQREIERAVDVPDPIRYLIAVVVLLLLFSAVTRFALRRRRKPDPATGEERESVLNLAAGDLLAALLDRLRRIGTSASESGPDPLARLRGDPRWAHTVAIREAYRALLARFRERGVPRDPATTPREHGRRLASTLVDPSARDDVALITDRYNSARYGDQPASAADADAVRAAWRRLEGGMSDT